jgi:hypothetical protein
MRPGYNVSGEKEWVFSDPSLGAAIDVLSE